VRLAPPALAFREIPIRDLPLYSYDYDKDFPAPARSVQAGPGDRECGSAHHSGIQPLDPGRAQECDRLGEPAARPEFIRT
jgi:hypothetical protein